MKRPWLQLLSLLALLTLLFGCTENRPDDLTCCTAPHTLISERVPTTTATIQTLPEASRPVPLRIYDLSQKWTPETRSKAKTVQLSGLPQAGFPLWDFTNYSLAPGRCRVSAPRFGKYGQEFRVELLVGEAVMIAGGVLLCDRPQVSGTTVAIVDAALLAGTRWTYR